jgi:hypothetical protein
MAFFSYYCHMVSVKAVLWIRIRVRINPHHFGNLDPHPDPHPHQSDKLDAEPDPHQFANYKPKCLVMSLFEPPFKRLRLYLEARIWIQIHIGIRVKSRIWIRIRIKKNPNPHHPDLHPDPPQGDKSTPDPHQRDADPQYWVKE